MMMRTDPCSMSSRVKFVLACFATGVLSYPVTAQGQQSTTDADQPLSRAEFIQQMDAEFRRFDGNGNGTVLPAEIASAQRKTAEAEALRQNQAVFAALDKNRTGTLSAAEFAGLVNPAAIAVDPTPLMAQLDTDKDGVVTLVEHRIATQANFDRIDTDRDGIVTVTEMRAARIVR